MLPVLHQCLHGLEISRNVIKLKAVLFEGGGAWWAEFSRCLSGADRLTSRNPIWESCLDLEHWKVARRLLKSFATLSYENFFFY
jgi:hypothetical protein